MSSQNKLIMWSERWPAPAKLNLMLRIVGRRSDGYHLLQTVFQFVDLCDWIRFHPVNDGSVTLRKTIPGVLESDDLTIRAANLLKAETGCEEGVCIEVEKNLPMGGGLGGGSSDAATTLLVLNQLWDLNLSVEKLMQLGLALGADVPVFIFGNSSWAEGVGEKLTKIILPEKWVVLIHPDCHVNTKEIFLDNDLTRDSNSITIDEFLAGNNVNCFQEIVSGKHSLIKEALFDLSLYSESKLTGTGACVFGEFSVKQNAVKCFDNLNKKWNTFLINSTNISPLHSKLRGFNSH
ncbi:MAG: 4-(cytidine 5'-diphospho)-2-C-methyl-D-erythritol kinase [Methylococcaceae bacterium]|nr:4-(cytidine 5'-diphospho)-2-C-methyl-D-erythritol kinase [Methylococcaceae bacterium]MDP3905363.1 4-(cytidine 5'-diphospho)-2-C-methyl-D-erythritol kinase [Methylococcaceae bacterium]